jgi:4-hydroxyphenylpyruvate dioxygenase
MIRSIATVSLGGTLAEKLAAIGAAGFDGLEIFENDLLFFDGTPADVRRAAGDLGLRILLFQPFRDFEAGPRDRLARNLERAEKKFDLMEQLGTDMMLVCSSVAPNTLDDDKIAADDLHQLGERAAKRGLRIAYEALAWGKHVRTYGHAWRIVQAANHPAVGVVVDSFHTLALDDDDSGIAKIPGDRIFFVQLADGPQLRLDVLSWSRHFRLFPGQGALPVTRFMKNVLASGYSGPLSLEIFNDDFRAAPPRPTAIDGMRSLMLLEEELSGAEETKGTFDRVRLAPPPPVCHGMEFVEFSVDAETLPRLASLFTAMGFEKAGVHRSKDVSVYRQGDINFIINAEKDSFAHSYFLVHGPSVCALAFRVDDAQRALERAVRYKAQTFRGRVGPNELVIPAVRGLDGSLIYLVDRFGSQGTIYDVDFRPPDDKVKGAGCGLAALDHVSQVMPRAQLDGSLLFYRSVFGFDAEPLHELVDPYGLIQSRVVESANQSIRIPLNASQSPKTTTSRFISTYSGAGVHHIALSTSDIFSTVARMRENNTPFLEIPETYYENLAATQDLPPDVLEEMQRLSILYDRSASGEFFHAYTQAFDGRFFFEIVQRKNYTGFGAVNASVRLAAQVLTDRDPSAMGALDDLAI